MGAAIPVGVAVGAFAGSQIDKEDPLRGALLGGVAGGLTGGGIGAIGGAGATASETALSNALIAGESTAGLGGGGIASGLPEGAALIQSGPIAPNVLAPSGISAVEAASLSAPGITATIPATSGLIGTGGEVSASSLLPLLGGGGVRRRSPQLPPPPPVQSRIITGQERLRRALQEIRGPI